VKVSVVVPVRNEEESLPLLLDSLLRQSTPADEILIVDGGSTDRTTTVAAAYAQRGVRVLSLGPAYPGRGRNEGAAAAQNDWVAFIDAGCEADPEWLGALIAAAGPDAAAPCAVFGSYDVRRETEWERAQALAYIPALEPATGCRPLSIASALVHRAAWAAAGRFREDLRAAEDLVFFGRLQAAGVPVRRCPRAVVTWRLPPRPSAMFRRFRLYSAHHLSAGLAWTWHRRVMATDGAAALLALGGLFARVPLLLLVLMAFARVVKTVHDRQANIAPRFAWRPDRIARVAVVLLLADAAVWMGALDHVRAGGRPVPTPG
jgi:glycosyltransferase involved in cell wall biosynthesis